VASSPTASEFLAEYPEFVGAGDALVSAKIANAVARTNETTWGTNWRMGVMLRTADLLAKSPYGRKMKMVLEDGKTAYWPDLRALMTRVAAGTRAVKGDTETW